MVGLVIIFIFVVLIAVPGFYMITRKVFPKNSKRSALWVAIGLTVVLVGFLALGTLGNWPA